MQLKIRKNNDNEIIVYLSSKIELIISEKREELNHEKINEFLVKVASSIPNDEKLELVQELENVENDNFISHIIYLFDEFCKNYNDAIEEDIK